MLRKRGVVKREIKVYRMYPSMISFLDRKSTNTDIFRYPQIYVHLVNEIFEIAYDSPQYIGEYLTWGQIQIFSHFLQLCTV